MSTTEIPPLFQVAQDFLERMANVENDKTIRKWYLSNLRSLYKSSDTNMHDLSVQFTKMFPASVETRLTAVNTILNCALDAAARFHVMVHHLIPLLKDTHTAKQKKRINANMSTYARLMVDNLCYLVANPEHTQHDILYLLSEYTALPVAKSDWSEALEAHALRCMAWPKPLLESFQYLISALDLPRVKRPVLHNSYHNPASEWARTQKAYIQEVCAANPLIFQDT